MLYLTIFFDIFSLSLLFPIYKEIIEFFLQSQPSHIFFQFFTGKPISFYAGLLSGFFSFLQFFFSIFWGNLSDSLGRKYILFITNAGLLFALLIFFIYKDFSGLLISRTLIGIFTGSITVATAALIDNTNNKKTPLGLVGITIGLAFLIGPFLGSLLYDKTHAFPLNTLLLFQIAIASCNFLGTFLIKETTIKKQKKSYNPFLIIFSLEKSMKLLFSGYISFTLLFCILETSLIFYAHHFLGFSSKENGYMFLYIGLCLVFFQGFVVRKIANELLFLAITPLTFLCSILLLTIPNIFNFALSLIFFSFSSNIANTCFNGFISKKYSEHQGLLIGLSRSISSLSRALAPLIFASFYNEKISFYLVSWLFFGLYSLIIFTKELYEEKRINTINT